MASIAQRITSKLWPEFAQLPEEIQTSGMANMLAVLYSAPLAVVGLFWLVIRTDLQVFFSDWWFFLLTAVLMFLLDRLSFFVTIDTGNGRFLSSEGSLDSVLLWSAIFLFGPSAIWLVLFFQVWTFVDFWSSARTKSDRWNSLRNLSMSSAVHTIGILLSLQLYESLGGLYPLAGLDPVQIFPAMAALAVFFAVTLLLYSGFLIYILVNRRALVADNSSTPIIRMILLAIALPNLANPVAVLAAGLFVQNTIVMYLFLVIGIFMVAFLARKLSMEAEFSRQRARQLEQLESLGEEIINSPPDASHLPEILEHNVPGMFPGRVLIWVAHEQILLRHPTEWELDLSAVDRWLMSTRSAQAFVRREALPWNDGQLAQRPVVVCPIYDSQAEETIGGIYVETRRSLSPWGRNELTSLFAPLHTLASQITSALHQAERYDQMLDYERISQELTLAGRIQASFLPNRIPDLPGWQLAVTLLPARATSGDFFDFIQLSENKLAIVIADVADKGIGPALYMALSRTLIRTFAPQYEDQPATVLSLTNQRILSDARAHLFVTMFYGVLDWETGTLSYCNAGHNPPMLMSGSDGAGTRTLSKTGIPIGIDADETWEFEQLQIKPGDVLVLYTDGVTEAQNVHGNFFDEDLLLEAAEEKFGGAAYEIQSAILEHLQNFVGNYPQSDDITLMILARDRQSPPTPDD